MIEGIDYTINKEGLMVMTREFLLKRGHCCGSGCVNCPYDLKFNPNYPSELQLEDDEDVNLPDY